MRIFICTVLGLFLLTAGAAGNQPEKEIEYLLDTIGNSGCIFVRNGSRHTAEKAEEHLRMKYQRGKRYAKTAELFIERLASKSSISKKVYTIECPGADPVPSGEWLMAVLTEYRSAS